MVPLNIGSDVFILVVFVCLHKRKSAFDISIKTKSHKTNQTCCWTSLELTSATTIPELNLEPTLSNQTVIVTKMSMNGRLNKKDTSKLKH